MTHDPLCPQQPRDDGATLTLLDGRPVYCACDLIAKVRQEEANARRDELLRQGEERMLRWAIKTVESISQAETSTLTHGQYLSRRSVLAALRALQP